MPSMRYRPRPVESIDLATIVDRHRLAILGTPSAAAAALIFVALAHVLDGPIALDFLGLKAVGARATSIIWISAILAISWSFRALW